MKNSDSDIKLRYFSSILLVLTYLSLLLLVFLILVVMLLFLYYGGVNEDIKGSSINRYHCYYEIDPFSNRSGNGIVKLNEDVHEEEYISFSMENSYSTFIIQKFGGDEYQCSGSCYCEDFKGRRTATSSIILAKGLFVFLTAFSITAAFKIAQEAFENGCSEKFKAECSDGKIIPFIQDCQKKEVIKGEKIVDDKKQWSKFICDGVCLSAELMYPPGPHRGFVLDFVMENKCEDFRITGEVSLNCEKFSHLVCLSKAKQIFRRTELQDYCCFNSLINYEVFDYSIMKKERKSLSACTGYKRGHPTFPHVENVRCLSIVE